MAAPAPLRFSQELTTGWQVTGRRAATQAPSPVPAPRAGGAPALAPERRPRPSRGVPSGPGSSGPLPARPGGRAGTAGAVAPRTGTAARRSPAAVRPPVAGARRLLVALVVAAGVGGAVLAGTTGGSSGTEVPERTAVVRVGAGETVWDVARRVAPGSEPAAVVERIRELNGLAGSAVTAGQPLQVPDGR